MKIKINGKPEEINIQSNLAELVLSRGLCVNNLVIEHNSCIVAREELQNIVLKENDTVEIVSFVGGG